jgi:hypothetical protein
MWVAGGYLPSLSSLHIPAWWLTHSPSSNLR